jgi:hypothetical protein
MLQMMAQVGKEIAVDEIKGGGGRQSFALTPADAQNAINAKYADETFMKAWNDKTHPGHGAAVDELNKLYAMAKPEQPKE